jgi:hypothetical protein
MDNSEMSSPILQILELLRENIYALPQELVREAIAEKAENIEAAYMEIYKRNQAGLAPEHIDIKD